MCQIPPSLAGIKQSAAMNYSENIPQEKTDTQTHTKCVYILSLYKQNTPHLINSIIGYTMHVYMFVLTIYVNHI